MKMIISKEFLQQLLKDAWRLGEADNFGFPEAADEERLQRMQEDVRLLVELAEEESEAIVTTLKGGK